MQERQLLRSLSSLRSSLQLSTVRTSQNGSHEGHEGDEGDEGNEGHEGDEGNESDESHEVDEEVQLLLLFLFPSLRLLSLLKGPFRSACRPLLFVSLPRLILCLPERATAVLPKLSKDPKT